MKTAIKERGEIDFASLADEELELAAGARWKVPGVVLRYRNSDMKRLESTYTPAFFNMFVEAALSGIVSMQMMEDFLSAGLKKDGQPYTLTEDVLDTLPITDVQEVIFEGICIAMRGMTAKAYVQQVNDAFLKAQAELNPSASPSSTT